jgi:hypothetical protein
VKHVPERENEQGFPRRHKRWVIGDALGISDERVRQIEEHALDNLGSRARPEHWVDRLVELIPGCFSQQRKRWLPPRILYEEEIAKHIPVSPLLVSTINRSNRAATLQSYLQKVGWSKERQQIAAYRFQFLLARGYVGNCPRR